MPIRFLGGKPRAGKSWRATKYLFAELTQGKRHIVTNLPLKLDVLQETVFDRGFNVHVLDRITVLDETNTLEFYRHRGRGLVLPLRVNDRGEQDEIVPLDVSALDPESPNFAGPYHAQGVLYLIDEIHTFFNAHKWKKVSTAALWYSSQHGKLGDDVWCITQSISNVVKQFRDLAQAFHYMRNRAKEKKGMFTMGTGIEEIVFLHPVEPGSMDEPVEGPFAHKLDEIANCYDTSAGVGVAGHAQADKGRNRKGVSIRWVYAAAAVVIVGFWVAAHYIPKLWGDKGKTVMRDVVGIHSPTLSPVAPLAPLPEFSAEVVKVTRRNSIDAADLQLVEKDNLPTVRGYAVRNGKASVYLSDGRVLTEQSGDFAEIRRTDVVLADGTRLFLKSPLSSDRQTIRAETGADSALAPPRKGRALGGLAPGGVPLLQSSEKSVAAPQ